MGRSRPEVVLVGVDDFADQDVNRVHVDAGVVAATKAAITDPQNARTGGLSGGIGETVSVVGADGGSTDLEISGIGSTLYYANWVGSDTSVLYVPVETVWDLRGFGGYTRVEFRVADRTEVTTAGAVDSVLAELAAISGSIDYLALPEERPAGEWPGRNGFDVFFALFWIVGGVMPAAAMVLIATTTNPLVRGQRGIIGITPLIGIAFGLPFSNALAGFLGRQVTSVELEFGFSWLGVALSAATGIGGAGLASLRPAE